MRKNIEQKVKDCTACPLPQKRIYLSKSEKPLQKARKLTNFGQKLELDFTGNMHNRNLRRKLQILVARDRVSKWPTAKICKTSETEEYTNFLTNLFILYNVPEKMNPRT